MKYIKLLKNFLLSILNQIKKHWLSIIIIVILIFLFMGSTFWNNLKTTKRVKKNVKILDYALNSNKRIDEIIQDLLDNPSIKKEEFHKLSDDKKNIAYDDIYGKNKILLNSLKDCNKTNSELIDALDKSNNILKSNKKFGFSIFAMAGLSGIDKYLETNKLNIDVMIGVQMHSYFLNDRLSLDYGLYVKPYDDIGFGGIVGFTIRL